MGWETRQRGTRYYTRSRRVGGRVVREYVGTGLLGRLAADLDAEERADQAQRRAAVQRERERLAPLEAQTEALCAAADELTGAALLLAGYHQHHRSEWRRRRA